MSEEFTVRGIRLLRPLNGRRGARSWLNSWMTLLSGNGRPDPAPGLYLPSPQDPEESRVWLGTIHIARSSSPAVAYASLADAPNQDVSRQQVRHIFQQNRIKPRSSQLRSRLQATPAAAYRLDPHRVSVSS
ncbi:MAG: hypothetical protein HC921_09835 [Synechococcaceae cyanobacterium SM2_3_1]|nr:hypothetical protein [Synechococcaceae cyanobacterium SM2_3_1]